MLLSPVGLLLSVSMGAPEALGAHWASLFSGWVLDSGKSSPVRTCVLPGGSVHCASCARSLCRCKKAVLTGPELWLQGQHRGCGGFTAHWWRQLYLWASCLCNWTTGYPSFFCLSACDCDPRSKWRSHPFIQQRCSLWVQQWDISLRGWQRGRIHCLRWAPILWAFIPPRETL